MAKVKKEKQIITEIKPRLALNTKTKQKVEFSGNLSPEEVVISAHAYLTVCDKDNRTHQEKYSKLINQKEGWVECGLWRCLK